MSVKIIVDSTADLLPRAAERVRIVPLSIRFGDREYIDGVTIDSRKFYEMLVESDVLPTTSQANPAAFEEAFAQAVEADCQVVCITCSAGLSGTYQSALIAAEEFPGKVFVVDSKTIALGSAILTEYALELLDRGCGAREIAEKLMQKGERVRLIALLDTLEYLKRGGRVSKTVAFAGGLLNIKPLISISKGEIKILGKARGSRQGNSMLLQEVQKAGGVDFRMPMMLGYTGTGDGLLRNFLADGAKLWQDKLETPPAGCIGSVVGTHTGPGVVAVAFFSAEE